MSPEDFLIFDDPATPLLHEWLRKFGPEATRKVAEEFGLSFYKTYGDHSSWHPKEKAVVGAEAALLAMELQSQRLLAEVLRPCHLGWRSKSGESLVNIFSKKLGESHEVTKLLQDKSNASFNN